MNLCNADPAAASVREASHRVLSSLDTSIIAIHFLIVFAIAAFFSRKMTFQKLASWPDAMVVFATLRFPGDMDIPFWLGWHDRGEVLPFA